MFSVVLSIKNSLSILVLILYFSLYELKVLFFQKHVNLYINQLKITELYRLLIIQECIHDKILVMAPILHIACLISFSNHIIKSFHMFRYRWVSCAFSERYHQ